MLLRKIFFLVLSKPLTDMPMALPLGELSPKVTERARLYARFRILALSVSLSLDSSPKGRAKNAAGKLLPLPSGEVARR